MSKYTLLSGGLGASSGEVPSLILFCTPPWTLDAEEGEGCSHEFLGTAADAAVGCIHDAFASALVAIGRDVSTLIFFSVPWWKLALHLPLWTTDADAAQLKTLSVDDAGGCSHDVFCAQLKALSVDDAGRCSHDGTAPVIGRSAQGLGCCHGMAWPTLDVPNRPVVHVQELSVIICKRNLFYHQHFESKQDASLNV